MYKLSIQVSSITTVISLFVSIINYLIAYAMGKVSIANAISSNQYVKYWVYLTAFFLGITFLLFIFFLIFKPKNKASNTGNEYSDTYTSYQTSSGSGPVEEYVNLRVKKSELSKYQQ